MHTHTYIYIDTHPSTFLHLKQHAHLSWRTWTTSPPSRPWAQLGRDQGPILWDTLFGCIWIKKWIGCIWNGSGPLSRAGCLRSTDFHAGNSLVKWSIPKAPRNDEWCSKESSHGFSLSRYVPLLMYLGFTILGRQPTRLAALGLAAGLLELFVKGWDGTSWTIMGASGSYGAEANSVWRPSRERCTVSSWASSCHAV